MEPVDDQNLDYDLLAAYDADNRLIGLVRSDSSGLFMRADNAWYVVQPTDMRLNGASIVDITDEAVKVYDRTGRLSIDQAENFEPFDGEAEEADDE